jgi:hypothetical protein
VKKKKTSCIFCIFIKIANLNILTGGQQIKQDKSKLKSVNNCQIAVGTPGRILHLITDNILNTSNIRLLILDEADKLLAPEFQESIKYLNFFPNLNSEPLNRFVSKFSILKPARKQANNNSIGYVSILHGCLCYTIHENPHLGPTKCCRPIAPR